MLLIVMGIPEKDKATLSTEEKQIISDAETELKALMGRVTLDNRDCSASLREVDDIEEQTKILVEKLFGPDEYSPEETQSIANLPEAFAWIRAKCT